MAWGKKPCCSGCADKAVKMAAGGAVVNPEVKQRAARLFADGGAARTDIGAADPEYTTIFPGSEYSTLGQLGGYLWRPFLRREVLSPEETRSLGDETIRINPETGMPETLSMVETIPGEYGPIELTDWPSTTDLLASGVGRFMQARDFLSRPENREQLADMAQELPGEAIQATQDYIAEQVDMANRGLTEAYDPESGDMAGFTVPLLAAEIMTGSLARPAVQLADNEMLTGMAVKGKGGVFERYPTKEDSRLRKPYDRPATIDKLLYDYREGLQDEGFELEDIDSIVKSAENYFTTDFGTPRDPLREMLRAGKIEPQFGKNRIDQSFLTAALRPYLLTEANRDTKAMNVLDRLIPEQELLEQKRGPEGFLTETGGFENPLDWEKYREIRNEIDRIIRQTGGRRPTIENPTDAMRDFENIYDAATGLEAKLYAPLDSIPDTFKPEDISKDDDGVFFERGIPFRDREYVERKPALERFVNQRATAIEGQEGFLPINTEQFVSPSDTGSRKIPRAFMDAPDLLPEDQFSDMAYAMSRDVPMWQIDPFNWNRYGLDFLSPQRLARQLGDVGIQSLREQLPQGAKFPDIARVSQQGDALLLDNVIRDLQRTGDATSVPPEVLLTKGVQRLDVTDNWTGSDWFMFTNPRFTELEGYLMNHSVGGYSRKGDNYNLGGREGFNSGRAKVFSLRDKTTGQPSLTADVDYADPQMPQLNMVYGPDNSAVDVEQMPDLFALMKRLGADFGSNYDLRNNYEAWLEDRDLWLNERGL